MKGFIKGTTRQNIMIVTIFMISISAIRFIHIYRNDMYVIIMLEPST